MKSGRVKVELDIRGQKENSVGFHVFCFRVRKRERTAEEKGKEEEKAKECSEFPSIQRGKGSESY